jgi:hypothetical protein
MEKNDLLERLKAIQRPQVDLGALDARQLSAAPE